MATIARQANIKVIANETALAQLIVNIKFADMIARLDEVDAEADLVTCELRGCRVAELFTRIDNRDGVECECCETCADTADVSYIAD